jgi:hypothetical protein
MARKRSRRNSDSSVLAIALNSHWGVSAAFSALVFGIAYLVAPAYVKKQLLFKNFHDFVRRNVHCSPPKFNQEFSLN